MADGKPKIPGYLRRDQILRKFGRCSATLSRWEAAGDAPPSIKCGRLRLYNEESFYQWLRAREGRLT
jgi:hypothetical protein